METRSLTKGANLELPADSTGLQIVVGWDDVAEREVGIHTGSWTRLILAAIACGLITVNKRARLLLMEAFRTRRIVLVSLLVLTSVLPLLWIFFASAGSQEHTDDDGEIEKTLQGAAVLLLLWSLVVGTVVRSLLLSLIVSAGGSAVLLAALCATLAFGYRDSGPSADVYPGFWEGAVGIALRGVGLSVLGTAVGFAVGGIARRLSPPFARPPVAGVSLAVLAAWLLSEAIGHAIRTGRFQLSTHLIGWLAGDWIIYRPPPSCLGHDAATCGRYHATWQNSLPILATVALVGLAVGWVARQQRATPALDKGIEADTPET